MSAGIRVLVCGGRDYADREAVYRALNAVRAKCGISCVIAGRAGGADHLAASWAKEQAVDLEEYPADWKAHGKAAGPIRNQRMLDEGKPAGVIAFPGGRGTADMVKRAGAAGLTVWMPVRNA